VIRRLLALLLAVLVTAAVSSVIQTLRVHAALESIGAEIPASTTLASIGHDLGGFAPTYAAIAASGFIIAFAVTGLLRRRWPRLPRALHALAGALAILTALLSMRALLGMDVVAGARGLTGLLLFVAAGALGGSVFAHFAKSAADTSRS
jgi:hypothetical protein